MFWRNARTGATRYGRGALAVGVLLATAAGLSACGGGGGGELAEGEVALIGTTSPLRDPVIGPVGDAFFALDEEGGNILALEVPDDGVGEDLGSTPRGHELEGAGENLAAGGPRSDFVFVPQPALERVQAVEKSDLLPSFAYANVSGSPVRVATDRDERELYALSADGRSVSVFGLGREERLGVVSTDGSEESLIEAPPGGGGRFWLAGPEGVALYDLDGGLRAASDFDAVALAADADDDGRVYAAEADSGRVVAFETGPAGTGLRAVAEVDVGEEVLYLATDEEGNLYAVTGRRLLLLDPGSLEVEEVVDLATEEVRSAGVRVEPSGLAVSAEYAFVTLEGTPHALFVGKPEAG
jgi:outer membrane protein assembly factor BamB